MEPFFNSRRPRHHKQKDNTAPYNQQGFSANPSLANSMQPQLGLINPQIPTPFNNSKIPLRNGQTMPNMPPLINQQHGLVSGPNDLAILQLQDQVNKLNALKMLMNQVNQLQGELFGPGFSNMPQQINQNMGLLQNPMQNMMNPVMPMQMPVASQAGSFNAPSSSHQVVGAQSPNFFVNQQVKPNQPNFVTPTTGANGSKQLSFANQQMQGNLSATQQNQNFVMPAVSTNGSNSLHAATQQVEENSPASQQSEKFVMPTMAANGPKPFPFASQQVQGNPFASQQSQNLQPSAYNRWQGNPAKNGQGSTPNSKRGNFSGKNFKNNPKREQSHSGHQKSEFHHMDNGKRKLGFSNKHGGKGQGNERAAKLGRSDPTSKATEQKRTHIYTEQEIKQWRESRRKHFPTKTNIEKKLTESLIDSGVIDKEANFRRKQLKEILAKQAELGVEVAEIPPEYMLDSEKLGVEVAETPTSYLLDSEKLGVEAAEISPHHLLDSQKQEHGREDNRKSLTKKGRFRNKHDRRGRYKKKGRSDMQTGLENEDRKPTLLEKLLCADIRRDKHRLLQVFRFMVANSFFKDWSDKPLKFPSVVVKEDGCEEEPQEEKSSLAGEEASEVRNNTAVEPGNGFVIGNCDIIGEVERVEEGEIID
uniref:FMR1-interacting protein 1 conserved domain-containing protein n=1 Tax=Salix viminalis TaxID=40686 RepID=A0A6N2M459_SALVM